MSLRSGIGNARWVLLATIVAGALGYLIQIIAPAMLHDSATYVAFSVLWSTIYLGVSALSGVQQEFARATHPVAASERPNALDAAQFDAPAHAVRRVFLVLASGCVVAALLIAAVLAARSIDLPILSLATPLAIALVGYLALAIANGMLSGLGRWRLLAGITVFDAACRAVVLALGFWLQWSPLALAYAIALPFGATAALAALVLIRGGASPSVIDETPSRVLRNTATTLAGALCMGAVISGLPLLFGVTSRDVSATVLGGVLFAIMLTRAPIVTPAIALQSYIVATFRDRSTGHSGPASKAVVLAVAVLGTGILLCGLGALLGPWLVELFSGGRFTVPMGLMAAIVASALLAAAMCVTGPVLVAQRKHAMSTLGWFTTALLTVGALLLPIQWELRFGIALVVPTLLGLGVHLAGLVSTRATPRAAPR